MARNAGGRASSLLTGRDASPIYKKRLTVSYASYDDIIVFKTFLSRHINLFTVSRLYRATVLTFILQQFL